MTELTVVKDNPYQGEKSAPPKLNWGVRERCWDEGALAQFVADQEKLPAIKQEAMRQRQSWLANVEGWQNLEQVEAVKQEVAQEIFEEIEEHWELVAEENCPPYFRFVYRRWQTLKQRMGVK